MDNRFRVIFKEVKYLFFRIELRAKKKKLQQERPKYLQKKEENICVF